MDTIVVPEIQELSREAGRDLLAARVSDRLSIPLDEFIRRADEGEYADSDDRDVLQLLLLIPFAR